MPPYSKLINPLPKAPEGNQQEALAIGALGSLSESAAKGGSVRLQNVPKEAPPITDMELDGKMPTPEPTSSPTSFYTAAPEPVEEKPSGLPTFLGGGGFKFETPSKPSAAQPDPPKKLPSWLSGSSGDDGGKEAGQSSKPSTAPNTESWGLPSFLQGNASKLGPTAAPKPPSSEALKNATVTKPGLPFSLFGGNQIKKSEGMGGPGDSLGSVDVPILETLKNGTIPNPDDFKATGQNNTGSIPDREKKGADRTAVGQAIGDMLSRNPDELLKSKEKDYGLDVDLDERNRLVADKAGQILFGAPNGVGINYKPSGDFALDVLGAIYATEPSQLGVSDERVKTGFREVNVTSCLETVRRLQINDFRFKAGFRHAPKTGRREDGKHRGFIAQQVAEVLPSASVQTK